MGFDAQVYSILAPALIPAIGLFILGILTWEIFKQINWKRILCIFGKHDVEKVQLLDIKTPFNKYLFFCKRCKKILFIGIYPQDNSNCFCDIGINQIY